MLLDAASLYFRAFYGVPTSVTTPDGRPINAVRGFLDMTARLLTAHRPDRLVACWDDDWRPAFRVDALPSYKAHRVAPEGGEEVPDELSPQVPILVEVLAAAGHRPRRRPRLRGRRRHRHARHPGHGPGRRRHRRPRPVPARRRRPRRADPLHRRAGIGRIEIVDEAAVTAKYGIPGRAYADFAVLRGDPSDGLPGVAGVGAKTAAALINEFGDLPADGRASTPATPAAAPPRVLKLHAAATTSPPPRSWSRWPATCRCRRTTTCSPRADGPAKLVELSERWGLDSPLNRVLAALRANDR